MKILPLDNTPRPIRPRNVPRSHVTNATALAAISKAAARRRAAFPVSDGTMGAAADQRIVGLQVTGKFSLLSLPFNVEEDTVKNALVADNWDVIEVRPIGFAGTTSRTYQIFANVYNRHSDNDVAASANRVLSGVMSNLRVELLRNPEAIYTDGKKDSDWIAEFFKGLGMTAAPSATALALGAGVLLLVLTRR